MFFLIRCIFWLWIVFSTIYARPSVPEPAPRHPVLREAAARTAQARPAQADAQANSEANSRVSSWTKAAVAEVAKSCAAAPAACLTTAVELVRHRQERKAPMRDVPAPAPASGRQFSQIRNVPLPPRRPAEMIPGNMRL